MTVIFHILKGLLLGLIVLVLGLFLIGYTMLLFSFLTGIVGLDGPSKWFKENSVALRKRVSKSLKRVVGIKEPTLKVKEGQ